MDKYALRFLVLLMATLSLVACGDDDEDDATPPANNSAANNSDADNNDGENNSGENNSGENNSGENNSGENNSDANNHDHNNHDNNGHGNNSDALAACEAACETLVECPELDDRCPESAIPGLEAACKGACASPAAQPSITMAATLECSAVIDRFLQGLGEAGAACMDDGGNNGGPIPVPETYNFDSRFEADASSVSYSGQTARHLLISQLNSFVSSLGSQIDGETFVPSEDGDVVDALDYYFRFDGDSNGDEVFSLSTTPATLQSTWNEVSSNKDIVGKLAGNDSVTDHKDWSSEFSGWSSEDIAQYGGNITSPEGLVVAFFETLEENAIAQANGDDRFGPGNVLLPVYVTESGLDLKQLIQKFLLGAVTFQQGADDYLDNDVENKGLLASNARDGEKAYSPLEHAWDEAFGYFGAARNYTAYSDDEIAGKGGRDGWSSGYYDTDGDGTIDLKSEFNFGASVNAAKRDRGATTNVDLTADAFSAFVEGRTLIANAGETLTEQEAADLAEIRDRAVGAWEKAIAATVVHYINDTIADMNSIGTEDYSFLDHAKHWSEMKGFALGLQFNPHSPLTDEQFTAVSNLMGDAPVVDPAGLEAYAAELVEARNIFRDAYGFTEDDAANW